MVVGALLTFLAYLIGVWVLACLVFGPIDRWTSLNRYRRDGKTVSLQEAMDRATIGSEVVLITGNMPVQGAAWIIDLNPRTDSVALAEQGFDPAFFVDPTELGPDDLAMLVDHNGLMIEASARAVRRRCKALGIEVLESMTAWLEDELSCEADEQA